MSPQTAASRKFTYDDFLRLPDDGKRHEIIDGEHLVTPLPNARHQVVVRNLYLALADHFSACSPGAIFLAHFKVLFSDLNLVEPDLLYISHDRTNILARRHVAGAPDLVVEVVSPGARRVDEQMKRELYDRFGVSEYWIADPGLNSIKAFRREDRAFAKVAEWTVEAGDSLTTPLLPGLAIGLKDVFEPPTWKSNTNADLNA